MILTDKKLVERLDQMLDAGINGTFEESDYDETSLSKLESKWLRFLTSSKLSYEKTAQEREHLKELVSDISHQTKTPLSNILLYTQLLQEQDLDDESMHLVLCGGHSPWSHRRCLAWKDVAPIDPSHSEYLFGEKLCDQRRSSRTHLYDRSGIYICDCHDQLQETL